MTTYYKIDAEKWETGWYYDYKMKEAFPYIDINKVYRCVSILESDKVDKNDTVLRVVINEDDDDYVYLPGWILIPIDIHRNNLIDRIIN